MQIVANIPKKSLKLILYLGKAEFSKFTSLPQNYCEQIQNHPSFWQSGIQQIYVISSKNYYEQNQTYPHFWQKQIQQSHPSIFDKTSIISWPE